MTTIRVYAGGHVEVSTEFTYDSSAGWSRYPRQLDEELTLDACMGLSAWPAAWDCLSEALLECESWGTDALLCAD